MNSIKSSHGPRGFSLPGENLLVGPCVVDTSTGRCANSIIPGAPFPVCGRHARQLYEYFRPRADDVELAIRINEADRAARRKVRNKRAGHVYYVALGGLIKIGYSSDLAQRLGTYPPARKLLATEPGTLTLEKQRHLQFGRLLAAGREWFRPEPELMDHIKTLRDVS